MYRALWSWLICVGVTVIVSYMTKPQPESELNGLVYGATVDSARWSDDHMAKADLLGRLWSAVFFVLNIIFW